MKNMKVKNIGTLDNKGARASIAVYWLRKHIKEYSTRIGYSSLILDIGGGESPYKTFFRFENYVTTDIERTGGIDLLGDICNLPIRDDIVDVVICTEVLEHVKDTAKAIKELSRVLKRGGYLILSTPLLIGEHSSADYFRFTELCLRDYLQRHFQVLELRRRGGIFSSIGSLLAHVPRQIIENPKYPTIRSKTGDREADLSHAFFFLLRMCFVPVTRIFIVLDKLDHRKHFTLGYDILAIKAN